MHVAGQTPDLKRSLIAYYPFLGNDSDMSGHNNHPDYNNATLTEDRFGKPNSAYYFNGSSYMQITNTDELCPEELSLCAIIKPMGFYKGKCYNNAIIDKGIWDYRDGDYALRFSAGEYTKGDCNKPASEHQSFFGAARNNPGPTGKDNYIKLNTWYCIVFTMDSNFLKLYLDGKLISTEKRTHELGANDEDLFLGKKLNQQYQYWFKGVMDEIRIYNRALSAEEVAQFYQQKE